MVNLYFAPDAQLTEADRMVMEVLHKDYEHYQKKHGTEPPPSKAPRNDSASPEDVQLLADSTIAHLKDRNNPRAAAFEPTVFVTYDSPFASAPAAVKWLLDAYTAWARPIVRVDTDVVMLTHLLLYFSTSIPSAVYLFYHFRWWHGVLHFVMHVYYMGTYTLMMHQHIHMRGILNKKFAWFDMAFPYLTDPLMGHTWNSYYFHHVKHHHIEGNGPDDLSSTVRYQRDHVWHFLHYVGRFYFFVWLDLPRYFLRKNKTALAMKAGVCEISNYIVLYVLYNYVNRGATVCTLLVPLAIMRLGLMIGNWGQHAFVDESEPDSDFRSSITLIDVASNRYCYNDGYHTSHHLNPLRHWRDHPIAFLSQKSTYATEHALVFYNIDYLMVTFSLLSKNYLHLARCMVPMGEAQMKLSLEERAEMLRMKTRRFSEEEIAAKWGKQFARLK
ncbi:fatty acid desaturase [Amniculicola lignicola CBS 123094]|uniref:Fatty acid desaturase n=1 Tax=Amniculicola lignicola CBS 123094 TaxID=1392246 RepID=A0A6A5WJ28_9PLEO|nr:fatty acid desaturase [Amniculicola lignicola CBS 123094]